MNKRIHTPKIYFIFSILTFFFLVFVSCFKNDDPEIIINPPTEPPPDTTTPPPSGSIPTDTIIGAYYNANNVPVFEVVSKSQGVFFDSITATNVTDSPLVDIVVSRLSIIKNGENLQLDSIRAQEMRPDTDGWIVDTEFRLRPFQRLETVNVVLVLDVSESLQEDFTRIKELGKVTSDFFFNRARNPKVGAVIFSTNISPLSLVTDPATVKTFIDGAVQGQFTALYDAILKGVEIVEADTADGESVIIFTDGTNNFGNADFQTTQTILKQSGIRSFTIGFTGKGNLNQMVLDSLALNGGGSFFGGNINDIEDIFELVSNAIITTITFTYVRNNQPISENQKIGLRFLIYTSKIE